MTHSISVRQKYEHCESLIIPSTILLTIPKSVPPAIDLRTERSSRITLLSLLSTADVPVSHRPFPLSSQQASPHTHHRSYYRSSHRSLTTLCCTTSASHGTCEASTSPSIAQYRTAPPQHRTSSTGIAQCHRQPHAALPTVVTPADGQLRAF